MYLISPEIESSFIKFERFIEGTLMPKQNLKAYIAWINTCIVWGTTYLAIRIGVEHIPPMLFAGIRWLVAGSGFIIYLRLTGRELPSRDQLIHIAIPGIALLGLGNGLVVVAEQWIPSGLTALLITTVPFWIVGIESFLPHGVRINKQAAIGLILGLAGIVLIFGNDIKYLFDPENLLGVFSLMAAVFFWSAGTIYSKYKKINVHPLMSAAYQMLFAGTLQTILGLSLGELNDLYFETNSFLSLLYLITFGSIAGYGSYIYAVSNLPLSLVSTYAYVNPVIALILGWMILGEELNIFILISAVIILAGVIIVKRNAGTPAVIPDKVKAQP